MCSKTGKWNTRLTMMQIWFQNRRQMTRRKARPSLPLQVYSSQESIEQCFSSSPILADSTQRNVSSQSSVEENGNLPIENQRESVKLPSNEQQFSSESSLIISKEITPFDLFNVQEHIKNKVISIDDSMSSESVLLPPGQACSQPATAREDDEPSQDLSQTSNIWKNPVKSGKDCPDRLSGRSFPALSPIVDSDSSLSSSRSLKRSSSSVRLSMSLDGKAQVVLEKGTTPSPPRFQTTTSVFKPRHQNTLKRSQSDYRPMSLSFDSMDDRAVSWPSRAVPGRSRDARTWEFYCDSDARNALTVQAEEEQKGSAEVAISLVRSSSSQISRASSEKQSTHANTGKEQVKRKKVAIKDSQNPKLARTASSVARLQTASTNLQAQLPKVKASGLKYNSQLTEYADPAGDSDKENWEPGTQTSGLHRRSAIDSPRTSTRPILGENASIPSHSTSLGSLMNRQDTTPRRRKRVDDKRVKEKEGIGFDEEVAKFMGESTLPGKEEDLDCVQNLLSLSQGAWR